MKRRVLLLLTALIVAAMMSVGPVFAHSGNHHCDWDGHGHDHWDEWCDDDNGDDDDGDGVLGFLPGFIQNIVD